MRLDHLLSKGFPLIVFLWVRGVARCRVLGRCALGRTPLPQENCVGGCGRVGCELHSGREHLQYVKLLRARVVGFEGVSMLMFCGSRSAAGSPVLPPPFLFSPFLVGWGCAGGGGPSCAACVVIVFV